MFDDEDRSVEIRVRLVIEGVVNKAKYLDNDYLSFGLSNFYLQGGPVATLALLSGAYGAKNTGDDVELIYNKDIFDFRQEGQEASRFQMHQLAGITGLTLMSIYPIYKAHEELRETYLQTRKLYNRVIYSPHRELRKRDPALAIMWTPASFDGAAKRTPNHFVPIVP